jgi:hypothetical protein
MHADAERRRSERKAQIATAALKLALAGRRLSHTVSAIAFTQRIQGFRSENR